MTLSAGEIEGLRIGLAATAFGFGLRHGVDWDHIAAITDVTSTQESPRRAMTMATLYAAGHGVVVFALGMAAVVFGDVLPPWVDGFMERLVGVSLIALAAYVAVSLVRHGRDFRMRSRWMVVAAGVSRAAEWTRERFVEVVHDHPHDHDHDGGGGHGHVHGPAPASASAPVAVRVGHRHSHRHVGTVPADPFRPTGARAATALGVLHGIGAETPTQVLLFLTAAHVAGTAGAVVLLALFIAGIFVSNTAIACLASFGYLSAGRSFRLYAGVAIVNATFSLGIGLVFLFGRGALLPPILGG